MQFLGPQNGIATGCLTRFYCVYGGGGRGIFCQIYYPLAKIIQLFDTYLPYIIFRRPMSKTVGQKKQDVSATKREDDEDNWDLPEGDTLY